MKKKKEFCPKCLGTQTKTCPLCLAKEQEKIKQDELEKIRKGLDQRKTLRQEFLGETLTKAQKFQMEHLSGPINKETKKRIMPDPKILDTELEIVMLFSGDY